MLQVFSKQASLMDTLITSYVSQLTQKSNDEVDNKVYDSQGNSDNGKCFYASNLNLVFFLYAPNFTNNKHLFHSATSRTSMF